MIAELIYKGATAEDLEMSPVEYDSRKETLDRFLLTWSGDNFQADYLKWLEVDQSSSVQADFEDSQYDPLGRENRPLTQEDVRLPEGQKLTLADKAKNFVTSAKEVASSGFAVVDKEVHRQRYSICETCEHLSSGQCAICGCFMKVKSKFEAMACPIDKW